MNEKQRLVKVAMVAMVAMVAKVTNLGRANVVSTK